MMKNGSLIIENVKKDDTGVKYVCSVQNKHGRDTASAFVDVKTESKIMTTRFSRSKKEQITKEY